MILIEVLITYIALVALAFPVVFSRFGWSKTLPGRATMLWSVIVALVLCLSALRVWGVNVPEWTRGAVYALVAIGVTAQLATLIRVQYGRQARDTRRELQEVRRDQ